MQSDMLLGQRSGAKKGTVKHTTVRYQSTKFVPLCRLNYRSHGIEIFSYLWFSLIVFGDISENRIALTKVLSLELKFSPRNRKCAKRVDISGCKMDWHCSVYVLSRVRTCRSKSKKVHDINFMLKTIFKICSNFSENAFFRIAKKIRLSGNFDFFSVFVLVLWTTLFTSALKPG